MAHRANQEELPNTAYHSLRVVSNLPSGKREKCHSDMHFLPMKKLVIRMI